MQAGIGRGGRLVLSMDTLPRRDALHDDERMAAVLGGRHWLLRVWKRIASLRVAALRSALQLARRAIINVQHFAHSLSRATMKSAS